MWRTSNRATTAVIVGGGAWLVVSSAYLAGLATPGCPTFALLGVECPTCGATRAGAALLRGDIQQAADHNLLLLIVVLSTLIWYAAKPWRQRSWRVSTKTTLRAAVLATALFWLLRVLPIQSLAWFDAA